MSLLIKGGLVVDPKNNIEQKMDILIEAGKIAEVAPMISKEAKEIIDASGLIVTPGFIDMHVHLREPGYEAKETILTGLQSALKGGFTTVACMPNTNPVIDNEGIIELINAKARRASAANLLIVGSLSKGSSGQEISEMANLKAAGIVALSDDGHPVKSAELMRRAMEYAQMLDIPVISHCEDLALKGEGVMHEGYWSTILGLKGIPSECEEVMVARDILLSKLTNCSLHLAHLSSKGSVEQLASAKKQGLKVTGEVTHHHLLLNHSSVEGYDTNTKVNPPLRTEEDRRSLIEAVKEGIIEVIATDHAPHTKDEKDREYDYAPFGISGLETVVPACWDLLIEQEQMNLTDFISRFTLGPSTILNLDKGHLSLGATADITIIDPQKVLAVEVAKFLSLGKNSPLDGKSFQGWPVYTIVDGMIKMKNGHILEV